MFFSQLFYFPLLSKRLAYLRNTLLREPTVPSSNVFTCGIQDSWDRNVYRIVSFVEIDVSGL